MGARANSANHLLRLGGGKNELHMRRRLLHQLEQSVKALISDHMGFVENKNLVSIPSRRKRGAFTQLTGVLHAVVGGGVNLHHIQRTTAAGS